MAMVVTMNARLTALDVFMEFTDSVWSVVLPELPDRKIVKVAWLSV
jgi:hypothetical protein